MDPGAADRLGRSLGGYLNLPANAHRAVALRAAAWDTHGNSVTSALLGAIGLR